MAICPHCGHHLPTTGDAFCPECRNDLADVPRMVGPGPGVPESPALDRVGKTATLFFFAAVVAFVVFVVPALFRREWWFAAYVGSVVVLCVVEGIRRSRS